jgi:hypothetical protein
MAERRDAHLRLSLLDMLKLIVACAVASACITPSFRVVQYGDANVRTVVIVDAIIVPLVFVLCSFVMVKRGPRRDQLVTALILCSASVALVALAWLSFPLAVRFMRFGPSIVGPIHFPVLATAFVVVPSLAGFVAWLGFRLNRSRRVDSRE